jgi:hypothetical protein
MRRDSRSMGGLQAHVVISVRRARRTYFVDDLGNIGPTSQTLETLPCVVVGGPARVPRLHLGVRSNWAAESAAVGECCFPDGRGCGTCRGARRLPGGTASGGMGRSRALL